MMINQDLAFDALQTAHPDVPTTRLHEIFDRLFGDDDSRSQSDMIAAVEADLSKEA